MFFHLLRQLPATTRRPQETGRALTVTLRLEDLEQRTVPATTLTWTGNGPDNLWSDAANWTHVGGVSTPHNGDTVIFQGELESLRRFKENVDEVRNGMECGIGVKQYNDVKPGDQIECFERIEVQRTL